MMPKRILKHPEWRMLIVSAVAAAVAIAALGFTLVVRIDQGQQYRQQTAANCMAIERLKADIRATLVASRDRLAQRTDLDPAQRAAALIAAAHEIARYDPDPCPSASP